MFAQYCMWYILRTHMLTLVFSQPSVRKTHCSGRKHKENVKDYYQKWMEEQAQSLIDKTSKYVLSVWSCLSSLVILQSSPLGQLVHTI